MVAVAVKVSFSENAMAAPIQKRDKSSEVAMQKPVPKQNQKHLEAAEIFAP